MLNIKEMVWNMFPKAIIGKTWDDECGFRGCIWKTKPTSLSLNKKKKKKERRVKIQSDVHLQNSQVKGFYLG